MNENQPLKANKRLSKSFSRIRNYRAEVLKTLLADDENKPAVNAATAVSNEKLVYTIEIICPGQT